MCPGVLPTRSGHLVSFFHSKNQYVKRKRNSTVPCCKSFATVGRRLMAEFGNVAAPAPAPPAAARRAFSTLVGWRSGSSSRDPRARQDLVHAGPDPRHALHPTPVFPNL